MYLLRPHVQSYKSELIMELYKRLQQKRINGLPKFCIQSVIVSEMIYGVQK